MAARTTSPFVLVVQWDGYVIDPVAWTTSFRRYDYIGAPYLDPVDGRSWVVGNGGFSLRSRKLLTAAAALPVVPGLNEDRIICQTFRGHLERDLGIRFAPERLADRFSFEQRLPAAPTFGFHGVFNLHRVEDDETVMAMVDALTPLEIGEGRLIPLMNQCLKDGRMELAARLFERVTATATPATLRAIVARMYGSAEFGDALIADLAAAVEGRRATPGA
jgi:hypothetical protein